MAPRPSLREWGRRPPRVRSREKWMAQAASNRETMERWGPCWMLFCCALQGVASQYLGLFAGEFRTQDHGVRGRVYVADYRTLFVQDFHYDGQGPDAFFWGDSKDVPTPQGFIISELHGSGDVLKAHKGQNLILRLPEGKSLKNVKSLSVWCRRFTVNFGHVVLPVDDLPAPKSLGPLPTLAHGVRSDDVIIQDARTILVTNLFYDGAGPDAFFLMGRGMQPNPDGVKIPDENGSLEKLRGYVGKDVLLHLPPNATVFDADWFALYCIRYRHNFGHVMLPERPNVPANMEDLEAASTLMETGARKESRSSEVMEQYYGVLVGPFKTNAHDVAGQVFAASEDTFYIKDFHYDGQGPDAYFWAGTTEVPSHEGFIVPDEFGTTRVLGKYSGQNLALTLPGGKKLSDIKWLSVWCRRFLVNFGHVTIPDNFRLPQPANLGSLSSLAHGVRSGDVVVKDARTLLIQGLHYDGAGPDAFFLVGSGPLPHPDGTKVPDENGSTDKLHGYQGQDVELRLPSSVNVQDIDWLALYCISFRQNFGHVVMTGRADNVPADLKSLRSEEFESLTFENCEEMFPGVLQVSWTISGQDIYMQLAGKVADNEYMAFGRSGHDDRAAMVGADVTVAFFDGRKGSARVVDYFLSSKSQCSRGSGACPDEKLGGSDDVQLLSWSKKDGILRVTFKRPLAASDKQDTFIPTSIPVSVIAAVGPLNSKQEVAYHTHHFNKNAKSIYFGRMPAQTRCTPLASSRSADLPPQSAWKPLYVAGATTFVAQIGPTGGDKGYTQITGSQSWGIAWWINGLLIPEITVYRGTNYTFLVEGGDDPENSAVHHPLYITNNPEGGGGQFLDQIGTPNHTVYAGITIDKDQRVIPTGEGRYCEWKHLTIDRSDESATFEDYKKTLQLDCKPGRPGVFTWTPDEDTPDLVYYQCFVHRNLGWRIRVLDARTMGTAGQYSDDGSSSTVPLSAVPFVVAVLAVWVAFRRPAAWTVSLLGPLC